MNYEQNFSELDNKNFTFSKVIKSIQKHIL